MKGGELGIVGAGRGSKEKRMAVKTCEEMVRASKFFRSYRLEDSGEHVVTTEYAGRTVQHTGGSAFRAWLDAHNYLVWQACTTYAPRKQSWEDIGLLGSDEEDMRASIREWLGGKK